MNPAAPFTNATALEAAFQFPPIDASSSSASTPAATSANWLDNLLAKIPNPVQAAQNWAGDTALRVAVIVGGAAVLITGLTFIAQKPALQVFTGMAGEGETPKPKPATALASAAA